MSRKYTNCQLISTGGCRISGPSTVVWLCGCIDYTLNLHWLLVMAFQAASSDAGARNFSWKPCAETWDSLEQKMWSETMTLYLGSIQKPQDAGSTSKTRMTWNNFLGSGNPKPTNKPSFVTWLAGILGPVPGGKLRPNPKYHSNVSVAFHGFWWSKGKLSATNFRKLNVWDPASWVPIFSMFFFKFPKRGWIIWAWTTRRKINSWNPKLGGFGGSDDFPDFKPLGEFRWTSRSISGVKSFKFFFYFGGENLIFDDI